MFKSFFWKSSIRLISTSGLVQLLAFLLLPVISRLYSEEAIGHFTFFLSLAGVLSVVAVGRMDHAIVLAPTKNRSSLLFYSGLFFSFSFSLLLLPLIAIALFFIEGTTYADQNGHLWLLPVFVFFMALYNLLSAYANSCNSYGGISLSQIAQGGSNTALRVGLGLFSGSFWSLQFALLLSYIIGIFPYFRMIPRRMRITEYRMKKVIRAYHRFPLYSMPQALVDILSGSLIAILLPLRYNALEIGFYGMAYMLAGRPLQIIADAMSRVWFRQISERKADRKLVSGTIFRFSLYCFLIAIVGGGAFYLWGSDFISFILGVKWRPVSYMIMAMLPFFFFKFLYSIFNFIPDLFSRQISYLLLQLFFLFLQCILLLVGSRFLDFKQYVVVHFLWRSIETFILLFFFALIIWQSDCRQRTFAK